MVGAHKRIRRLIVDEFNTQTDQKCVNAFPLLFLYLQLFWCFVLVYEEEREHCCKPSWPQFVAEGMQLFGNQFVFVPRLIDKCSSWLLQQPTSD
jgi:hypothetical protein